jgi:hypothetical protein
MNNYYYKIFHLPFSMPPVYVGSLGYPQKINIKGKYLPGKVYTRTKPLYYYGGRYRITNTGLSENPNIYREFEVLRTLNDLC